MPTLFAMSGYLVWAYAYINIYIPSLFSFYSTDFRFPPSLQAYCGNPRNWTLTFCCSLFYEPCPFSWKSGAKVGSMSEDMKYII